ncbi:hypothetical protein QF042_000414 [Pedobacter sp. W3I1]|uniref:hypothetical protein n=1 Tax=Pedobacter sp. W3I1 TaxID=3042291 RepID=UPI002785BD42|nr:hypothetical protein [Pedobacter sp. W3I1]MDQ0636849.1 hypothetical protein [Pedobacter sp. W3I1]
MKSKIYLLLLSLISISSVSCMKNRDNLYSGPDVVEFVPLTATVKKGTPAAPGTAVATIQLVGHQQSVDTEIIYEVATTSTGTTGTHFSLSGTTGKVIIPANSSSANITITAIPANIATGTRTVVLNLLGNGNIAASANYKTYTLTITQ